MYNYFTRVIITVGRLNGIIFLNYRKCPYVKISLTNLSVVKYG